MKKTSAGFSLVELLAAMLAAAVLALTVGLMLSIAYRTWINNGRYMDLQREVTIAQSVVQRRLRPASYLDVVVTNNMITVVESGLIRKLHQVDSDLVYDPDVSVSGDELVVSDGHVDEFIPLLNYRGVLIQLRVRDMDTTAEIATFVSFRN